MSYEELRREYRHVSPGLLPQLLALALQAQRAGSQLLQGLDSLLGAGKTVELSTFHYPTFHYGHSAHVYSWLHSCKDITACNLSAKLPNAWTAASLPWTAC